MQQPPEPEFVPFTRRETDADWDADLPCETPDCDDPQCPMRENRYAMRIALGSVVESMEAMIIVQALSQEYWGGCPTPTCTFEGEMQTHFSSAGQHLAIAYGHLLDGIRMWKRLPPEWSELERDAAIKAIRALKHLNLEALRQIDARAAGSPDPRNPDLTPRAN